MQLAEWSPLYRQRDGISPPILAVELWQLAEAAGRPNREQIAALITLHFLDKFRTPYVEAYLDMCSTKRRKFVLADRSKFRRDHDREQCIVTIEAYLRRLCVAKMKLPRSHMGLEFKEHPTYQRATAELSEVENAIRRIQRWHASSCQVCSLVGETTRWFGWVGNTEGGNVRKRCICCRKHGALNEQHRQRRR